jgi:hypothetical protein
VSLRASRLLRPASTGGLALLLWTASLPAIAIFPKHNWAVGPSAGGTVHRIVALVGFLSLPVAAVAIGWAARAHLSPLGYAIASQPFTGIRWWRAVPLGAVERLLALCEVVTVLALGWWAMRASHAEERRPAVLVSRA